MPELSPTWRRARAIGPGLAMLIGPMFGIAMAGDGPADSDGDRLFREKIVPILKAECFRCHSAEAEKLRGGLSPGFAHRPAGRRRLGPSGRPGAERREPLDPGHPARGRPGDATQETPAVRCGRRRLHAMGGFRRAVSGRERLPAVGGLCDRAGPEALGVPAGQEGRRRQRSRTRPGCGTSSMPSSSPGWKADDGGRRRRPRPPSGSAV